MYLVDTNVMSAGAPTRATPDVNLAHWMDRNSASLFLSVVTIAEIEDGIAKSRRDGATRKAEGLSLWLETLLHLYAARVLPVDLSIARIVGALSDRARGAGVLPGFADLAIAATAQARGLTLLTRNIRHFRWMDIDVHDPFESLPEERR
jgi:predicted nucleic acid-binding protein